MAEQESERKLQSELSKEAKDILQKELEDKKVCFYLFKLLAQSIQSKSVTLRQWLFCC